ncbi:MAG TPA: type II toxin-antitoxin system prevent-host-death family antitoxin [Verrucomicrobiae bacterium]|nr:type II toxin-antitoxin system prevent-host-death family antitoxin [Verrucomicrobiae bacterium]
MTTVDLKQAKAPLAKYARDAKRGPIVVTTNGKPVAAVVSVKNADLETIALSTDSKFLAVIDRSRTRQARQGGISPAEMRRRLGLS